MCAAPLVLSLLLPLAASTAEPGVAGTGLDGSDGKEAHYLVTCRHPSGTAPVSARWEREWTASSLSFLGAVASAHRRMEPDSMPIGQCPRQVEEGCYSTAGSIYCSDVALERVLFALALLIDRAEMDWDGESALDMLGTYPYTGYPPISVADRLLFPEWWRSYEGRWSAFATKAEALPWIVTARGLHEERSDATYEVARDLVVWFILGHEIFHALRSCPITKPSVAEASGYLESAVALQQHEFWCPSPPDNVEVNADACGLRWLEHANWYWKEHGADRTSAQTARASAMLILQALFEMGLRAPPRTRDEKGWHPSGYLYPHLRTATVHRTLFNLGGGDARVGICWDALRLLWDDAYRSGTCVTHASREEDIRAILIPAHPDGSPVDLFPSVEMDPQNRQWACLSGTHQLPRIEGQGRGDPSVTMRVTALVAEAKDQWIQLAVESAQMELDRPHIHAALSSCMPQGERKRAFDIRYTATGELDEVRGGVPQECDCVRRALKGLKFGQSVDRAPIDPTKPYREPGFVMRVELRRE